MASATSGMPTLIKPSKRVCIKPCMVSALVNGLQIIPLVGSHGAGTEAKEMAGAKKAYDIKTAFCHFFLINCIVQLYYISFKKQKPHFVVCVRYGARDIHAIGKHPINHIAKD